MSPMKIARFDFAGCRVENIVYCIGGRTLNGETSSVELFNLDLNLWGEEESASKSFTGIGWVRNTITDNFFEQ